MKTIFILSLLLALQPALFAQEQDCKFVHEGKFRLVDKLSGTTMMTRTKDFQTEENAEMGYKVILAIKWIDECTFEMRIKEVVKGDPALLGNKGDVMTVHIKEVNKHSYIAVTTANFADFVLTREVEIL